MWMYDIKKIIRIACPLLWYYAVTGAFAVIPGLLDMNAAARVAVSALICTPPLFWSYIRERRLTRQTKEQSEPYPAGLYPPGLHPAGSNSAVTGSGKTAPMELKSGAACIGISLACFLLGAALSALSAELMQKAGIFARFSNAIQESYQASPAMWLILGPGLLAPVCEELVYRGLLYGRLRHEIPAAGAALVSSLLFALGHGNVIQFLYAFPMGLLLCGMSSIRLPCGSGGNLLYPIMLHLGSNLYAVLMTLCR